MRVGLLAASASRQAGGLFWVMRSLAGRMLDADCEVQVFAGRDRHSEDDRSEWGRVPLHILERTGPKAFSYMPGLRSQLHAERLDILHNHGLWMFPSVAARDWGRRTRKPWVVSPHGMLDPWAVKNSRWKKRVAGFLYENRHLRGAACLHALCDAEALALRDYGLTNPIAVIPNGVELPVLPVEASQPGWAKDLPDESQVLLFLGRLHPKKGIPNLLQAWARNAAVNEVPWFLVIAGWDQNDHRIVLEKMVDSLGIRGTVRFVGPQFGQDKTASLLRADAFVLPSYSEGLPMAVLEAWAYRLPVLMTPQCNLPEGFAAGAAVAIEPEAEAIRKGLVTLTGMNRQEREQMGARGRHLVEDRFTWHTISEQMCGVYSWVLGQQERPKCVRLD